MSSLTNPKKVVEELQLAIDHLSLAHGAAGEKEGDRVDLTGHVRDAIFALNSAVDALKDMIAEEYNIWPYDNGAE